MSSSFMNFCQFDKQLRMYVLKKISIFSPIFCDNENVSFYRFVKTRSMNESCLYMEFFDFSKNIPFKCLLILQLLTKFGYNQLNYLILSYKAAAFYCEYLKTNGVFACG